MRDRETEKIHLLSGSSLKSFCARSSFLLMILLMMIKSISVEEILMMKMIVVSFYSQLSFMLSSQASPQCGFPLPFTYHELL